MVPYKHGPTTSKPVQYPGGFACIYQTSFIYDFTWHGLATNMLVQYPSGFASQLYNYLKIILNKVCGSWLVLEYIKSTKHITQNFKFNP